MGQRDGSHGQSSLHPGTPPKILSDHVRAIARNASGYFDRQWRTLLWTCGDLPPRLAVRRSQGTAGQGVAGLRGSCRGRSTSQLPGGVASTIRLIASRSAGCLAELFTVSRATVYRVLERHRATAPPRHRSLTRRGTPILVFALEATATPTFTLPEVPSSGASASWNGQKDQATGQQGCSPIGQWTRELRGYFLQANAAELSPQLRAVFDENFLIATGIPSRAKPTPQLRAPGCK
jgi:hypothetical protein